MTTENRMKALTLWQPWASLVAHGHKRIETRSWSTDYRGPLAIHAAKRSPDLGGLLDPNQLAILEGARAAIEDETGIELPRGCVIAYAELYDVVPTSAIKPSWREVHFGDYRPGRFAWLLRDIQAIEPVPATGARGLWDYVRRFGVPSQPSFVTT